MENKYNVMGIAAIIGLVIIVVTMVAVNAPEENKVQNMLSVSGTAELSVAPDQAILYINILTEGPTAQGVQSENRVTANKVMDALKAAGIKEKDIATSNYYLYKKTTWDENTKKNIDDGYALTHQLKITTTDIENVGSYVDKAVTAGANGVDQITFSLTKEMEKQVKANALTMATTAAKDKAASMASTAGVQLEKITSISESNFYYAPYAANVKANIAGGAMDAASNIAPQNVDVTATVAVTYEIE
jgi:uncharacterized protein